MAESPLHNLILEEIRARGPMTFARFMELALYHPEHGYYQSKVVIGREGDFYTSPHVTPLFGRLVGKQLREMWERLGRPARYQVVEVGAGPGLLAREVLKGAAPHTEFAQALQYLVVETSRRLRDQQRSRLGQGVAWRDSLEELAAEGIEGCVLSNELLDSFPVHRVTMADRRLRELYVCEHGGNLVESVGDLSDDRLSRYFEPLDLDLPDGIRTEVNLGLRAWTESVARALRRGFVLTIDYGFPAREYYSAARMDGTLRAYRGHRMSAEVLRSPGEQDLTSHVDFTTLARSGEEAGLATLGFTDQTHFLMGIGEPEIGEALAAHAGRDLEAAKRRSAILNLIHPEMMGGSFKVLIQGKGVGDVPLGGLANARGRLW